MIGYPYYYGNEIFVLFSLDSVTELSELSELTQAASLPIFADTLNLELGDEFTYEFCDQISQVCTTFRNILKTKTVVIDYNEFRTLAMNADMIIDGVSHNLSISKKSAIRQAYNFFETKTVMVQVGGIQGALYQVGAQLQSAGSAGLVANNIGLARLAGINGLQILQAQPILALAIPTTGAIFFYGCGAIAGENPVGKILITAGDALALPMRGTEVFWNSYGNPVIQKVFGIPLILNMTQTFKIITGYTIQEVVRYIKLDKKSAIKTLKDKTIKSLSKIINWLAS